MLRAWLLPLACAATLASAQAGPAPDAGLARFRVIEVAPVQTSVYVARVTLSASPFQRKNGTFAANYTATVFPFFFYNEKGWLQINLADKALRQLAAGATIAFSGTAVRSDGLERLVEGNATATSADAGTLKVRLHVNRHLVLVFNTTYRLLGPSTR